MVCVCVCHPPSLLSVSSVFSSFFSFFALLAFPPCHVSHPSSGCQWPSAQRARAELLPSCLPLFAHGKAKQRHKAEGRRPESMRGGGFQCLVGETPTTRPRRIEYSPANSTPPLHLWNRLLELFTTLVALTVCRLLAVAVLRVCLVGSH